MARDVGHLTAAQAATLANEAEIDSLLLTHISRRYAERQIAQEARGIFPNSTVARDLDHFQVSRDGAKRVEKPNSAEK